jgi:hypothetical protein|tara:strand:+ start:4345 stop:4920 length:576 start_codon:yes stop_codon:yes gene_type:complete
MNNDSVLKKEFKKSDVQRVRNLVNKDFTGATKSQSGYKKSYKRYKEGDIWEVDGRKWTIKNGIKQNITKLDSAKKSIRIPLICPKCSKSLKHHLHTKMYKIHGFCLDCTVDMEHKLKLAGLYKQYEQRMLQGNMKVFAQDIEAWAGELVNTNDSYVTEGGDIEDWRSNNQKNKEFLSDIKEYIQHLSKHIK